MDPKDLSKQKSIYKLYQSVDGLLHIEKFPIIYANKANVYFKTARYSELACTPTRFVRYDLTAIDHVNDNMLRRGIYFWNDPGDDYVVILKDIKKRNLEKRMLELGSKIYAHHREIERLEKEVDKIKKELEGLEIRDKR